MPLDPSIYQGLGQQNTLGQLAGSINQYTENRGRLADLARQREMQDVQMQRQEQQWQAQQAGQLADRSMKEQEWAAKQAETARLGKERAMQIGSLKLNNYLASPGATKEGFLALADPIYKEIGLDTTPLYSKAETIFSPTATPQSLASGGKSLVAEANPELATKQMFEKQDEGSPVDIMMGDKPVKIMSGSRRVIGPSVPKQDTTLVQVQLPSGETVYQPRSTAAGMKPPEKAGAAGKITPQSIVKDAQESNALLLQAEKVGKDATGSGLGTARDVTAGFFGVSTEGAQSAAKMKVLGASLTAKVPKMSGPQSDKDVAMYKEAAGNIADPNTPWETKQAAIETIREINNRQIGYASEGLAEQTTMQPTPTKTKTGATSSGW